MMARIKVLQLLVLRPMRRSAGIVGLGVAATALGVALWLAVGLVGDTAEIATERAMDALVGKAELTVDGGPIAQGRIAEVAAIDGVRFVVQRVTAWAERAGPGGDRAVLRVLGVQWDIEAMAQIWRIRSGRGIPREVVEDPDAIVIGAGLARALRVDLADELELSTPRGPHAFRIRAIIEPVGMAAAHDEAVVFVELRAAQRWFGVAGAVDHLSLLLDPGVEAAPVVGAVARLLGPGVRVVAAEVRRGRAARSLRTFQVTWALFAALCWFAGVVTVAGSAAMRVRRRIGVFAMLRRVGASPLTIVGLAMVEPVVVGVLGGVLGAVLATQLAAHLAPEVAATAQWFIDEPIVFGASPAPAIDWLRGLLAGLAAGICGGFGPAILAARAGGPTPAGASRPRRTALEVGLAFGCIGWVVLAGITHVGRDLAVVRAANMVAALLATALLAAPAVRGIGAVLSRVSAWRGCGAAALPAWTVSRLPHRARAAAVILAVSIGVVALITEVRGALERSVDAQFASAAGRVDFAVGTPRSTSRAPAVGLDDALLEALGELPGVARAVHAVGTSATFVERFDVVARAGFDVDAVVNEARALVAGRAAVLRFDAFRSEVRRAVERSLGLLDAVRVVVLTIAIGGMIAVSATAVLARRDQLEMLGRVGASPSQLLGLTVAEGVVVGIAAGLAAAPVVSITAAVWTTVTLEDLLGFGVPWRLSATTWIGGPLLGALVAGVSAAVVPRPRLA